MKRLFVSFLLCFLALSLFLGTVKVGRATPITVDRTFTSQTYDGFIYFYNSTNYTSARNAAIGQFSSTGEGLYVGQGSYFYVYRTCLYFDTSILPDNASITAATLSFYIVGNYSTTDFNVTIQNGQPTYPHIPLEAGDYDQTHYSGDGGSRNTSEITSLEYWNITLNNDGMSWVDVDSSTKLCLRSSRDIAATTPTGNEFLLSYSVEQGEAYAPKLYVTYETEGYVYTVHGPYYENGQVANCISNVTLFSKTNNPYSFIMNGTDGAADTVTIQNDTCSWYFQWNASATNSRSYYLKSASTEEFWVYVADPSKTYAAYTISFLDLAGILKTMPHVKAERYINGVRIVERGTVDVEKKVVFYMESYASYSITVENDVLTYSFGDLTFGSSTSITLTLKAVDFPKQTLFTYKYVRVYGERALGTPNGTITITYQDLLNKTTSVQIWINYKNGTNIVYTTEYTDSFIYEWGSASNDTDYSVVLGITHETYGYYGWRQYFPRGMSAMPWGMDWMGTMPFNTAYIIPAFLIIFAGACFSVVNAYVGAFMMVIVAAIESYIGWLPIPSSVLVAAFTFAVILAIVYAKKRIQE